MNNCYYPDYFTKYHKETEKYYYEFKKEYEDSLNETQKEDFNTLIELDSAFSSTSSVYNIIYGMKIKSALDEIINNPLKILEAYDGKTTCARKQYKSVKQKMKENNNG